MSRRGRAEVSPRPSRARARDVTPRGRLRGRDAGHALSAHDLRPCGPLSPSAQAGPERFPPDEMCGESRQGGDCNRGCQPEEFHGVGLDVHMSGLGLARSSSARPSRRARGVWRTIATLVTAPPQSACTCRRARPRGPPAADARAAQRSRWALRAARRWRWPGGGGVAANALRLTRPPVGAACERAAGPAVESNMHFEPSVLCRPAREVAVRARTCPQRWGTCTCRGRTSMT